MDAGTIDSLLEANTFAASFAGSQPVRTDRSLLEVDAEVVDPTTVQP